MREGAFLGCLKNLLYEFKLRYPLLWSNEDLIRYSPCQWLISLQNLVDGMNPDVWESLFPASVTETPQRTLFSLPLGVRKFQKKFVSFHESLDYTNCISLAKVKSPAFCAFLQDMSSDSASTFITQLPGKFIFNLKDHEWLVSMRLRLGFWPFGLLQNSTCICKNKHKASFHHLVNCSKFIYCRSILHNSLRDTCLEMFKANGFHGKVEPLLSHLSDHPDSTQKRGDFIGPWLSCQEIVVDFTTVDPCKASAIANILNPSNDPLKDAENAKVSKYGHQVAALNSRRHNNIVFQPFAVSLEISVRFLSLCIDMLIPFCPSCLEATTFRN
ncbi:hypothetical protein GEMRC1_002708 [Eukaryota sp. GEM-RC1]